MNKYTVIKLLCYLYTTAKPIRLPLDLVDVVCDY